MKKIIMTAAAAIFAIAGANAQSGTTASDVSTYTVNVPQVLKISTTPNTASFTHNLSENQLMSGKTLQSVTWNIKSNGMWKAGTTWSVTGSATNTANDGLVPASIVAFRNAMQYRSTHPVTNVASGWNSLGDNGPTTVDPIPGYESMSPTSTAGINLLVEAQILPMEYNVVPGTYIATSTITVTAL